VKLEKLTRQLRRDLLANPKKAAVLGLMLLVALYFWAPMLVRWMKPGKGAKTTASVGDLILEDEPTAGPSGLAKANKGFRWERVRQLMEGDERLRSAAFAQDWRNPFASPAPPADAALATDPEIIHHPVTPPDVHPATAGLALRSVVTGVRSKAAMISGEVYREGELVPATEKSDAGDGLSYRLVRIARHAVELERNGKTFWLELDRPKMAKGDAVTRDRRD
jgi:hypothetical protein